MSSPATTPVHPLTVPRAGHISRSVAGPLAAGLSVVGVLAVFSTVLFLYSLWTTDPLKSIGSFVPVISLLLILRQWRALGWELNGSWWGLAILVPTVVLVHLRDRAVFELVLSPSWAIFLPPHSLVAVLYAAGTVLLFGGPRLLRAAWFPVLLMWLVNPVPHFFTLHVDLPLQHASAHIARAWAQSLGYPLTPDNLRLMFTPEFGMFIAPGCNGIRGAITMGLIALVAQYVYRFGAARGTLFVLMAVTLGYVFNFVRLCLLVLYYIVALHWTWLQTRAEMGDYIIGATLFLFATVALFSTVRRFSPTRDLRPPTPAVSGGSNPSAPAPRAFWLRFAAMLLLVVAGSSTYAVAEYHARNTQAIDYETAARFPKNVGPYTLVRTWNEHLIAGGPLIFNWADYAAAGANGEDGTPVISIGLSPVLGSHDTLICHAARGEDWLWHGPLRLNTEQGPIDLSGSFFNDGATQYLEATTICSGNSCGQATTDARHFGLIYSKPDPRSLLGASPDRPIPVLLRAETTLTDLAPDVARKRLTDAMAAFLTHANLPAYTAPLRGQ